jgi:hypothetical protein
MVNRIGISRPSVPTIFWLLRVSSLLQPSRSVLGGWVRPLTCLGQPCLCLGRRDYPFTTQHHNLGNPGTHFHVIFDDWFTT